jgi:hypothetical protein
MSIRPRRIGSSRAAFRTSLLGGAECVRIYVLRASATAGIHHWAGSGSTACKKVIRMALDGKPELDNPLYNEDDIHKTINYAWAYGFRNPFGLNIIDDKVIVAENGVGSDQFLDIQRGKITSGMGMIGASRQTRTMSI